MNNERLAHVRANLRRRGLSQMLLVDPLSIWWLCGYYTEPYERFLALYVPCDEAKEPVHVDVADDELAVVDAHAADAGGDAGLVRRAVVLHARETHVDGLILVGLGVDLVDAGQAGAAAGLNAAAEVELAVVDDAVAEERGDPVGGLGHEELELARLHFTVLRSLLGGIPDRQGAQARAQRRRLRVP